MTNNESIAELRAAAAQAAAEAAAAKAAAAQAALEAALAKSSNSATSTPETTTSPTLATSTADTKIPAQAKESTSTPNFELSESEKLIFDKYQFQGQSFTLGTYLAGDTPKPGCNINIPVKMLNRHGLIAGATGSGKTRTLQLLAESLSNLGVSTFVTDVKGDLTGMAEAGAANEKLLARTQANGQNWVGQAHPLELMNLGGTGAGANIRTTVTDMGPLLLSRILELNETQEAALQLVFHWADQNGYPVVDLSDLRAIFDYLNGDEGKAELEKIGGVSKATAGVILRNIATLEAQGASEFFGEPAFDTADLLRHSPDGAGVINVLEVPDIMNQPKLLSTFLMWLLADLFTNLPEVGDLEQPKLVFFFDEAHLLFDGATPAFVDAVIRTVRLIRSKGVGIFFITQTPKDLPDDVLAQLGCRIQHVLRAFTPKDQKAIKATVETFPKTAFDLAEILTNLGTGEAIVTVLDEKGAPTPVVPTKIWAPTGVMGEANPGTISHLLASSNLLSRYGERIDPRSAAEILAEKMTAQAEALAQAEAEKQAQAEAEAAQKQAAKEAAAAEKQAEKERREAERAARNNPANKVLGTVLSTAARAVTYQVVRSLFGTRRR